MRWKHTGDRAHESRWPPGRTATALITLELLMLGVLFRGVLVLAIAVLAVVALLGAVALVTALLIIPSQDYSHGTRVFGRHLIGFIAHIVGLAGVVLLLRCGRLR